MERIGRIKAAKTGYILISTALCVLGAVLMATPDFSAAFWCRVSGVIMMLFGVVKIIGYFSRDLYRLAFQHDLAGGILLITLGLVLIVRTAPAMAVLCVIFGIYALWDALLKIQISIDSKKFGISRWWLILASAILTGAAGVLLIFRPTESVRVVTVLFGLTFIAEGVLNFITILTAVKIVRRERPVEIDPEHYKVTNDRGGI